MKDYPSIARLAELQQMIADFSEIKRVPHMADKGRSENDAEHSYGLALTCWFLAPKIAPELNLQKLLSYALVHDLVELHTGDTFAFDAESVKTKDKREKESLEKIQKDWSDFPEMIDTIHAYENRVDEEANFVYTIDKILPSLMVNLGEKEKFWHKHKVTKEMHEAEKQKKMTRSKAAMPYLKMLNDWLANPDHFYKPKKEK